MSTTMLGPGMPCLFREMFNKIEKYMVMVEETVVHTRYGYAVFFKNSVKKTHHLWLHNAQY